MTNPPDDCRAAFEAWIGRVDLGRADYGTRPYISDYTAERWRAWQAGWSACAVRRPEPEPAEDAVRALWARMDDAGTLAVIDALTVWVHEHYPADIFDGSSGDPGAVFVVEMREALSKVNEARAAQRERERGEGGQ